MQNETSTDKERILLAKKMFRNAVESDPNRNLSYHEVDLEGAVKEIWLYEHNSHWII